MVKNSGVHSCEVEPEPTSLRGGLQFFLDDGKVQLLAHDQLLAVVSGPLQVGGGEGGIDGFEPLSLQDRKPPKHRMYHHQFSLSTHACVCACVTVCEGDCVLPSKCMSASACVRMYVYTVTCITPMHLFRFPSCMDVTDVGVLPIEQQLLLFGGT